MDKVINFRKQALRFEERAATAIDPKARERHRAAEAAERTPDLTWLEPRCGLTVCLSTVYRPTMSDRSEEFRKAASECLDMACLTSDERIRASLMMMAQRWLDLANESRGGQDRPERRGTEWL
jgi:hypothetical protein